MFFKPRFAVYFAVSSTLNLGVNARSIETRDACSTRNRTFRMIASSLNGLFGPLTQKYLAEIEYDFDPNQKLAGPEVSSCTINKFGSGCKWTRQEDSSLDSFTVGHVPFNSQIAYNGEVTISGDDCNDQVLQCVGDLGVFPVGRPITLTACKFTICEHADSILSHLDQPRGSNAADVYVHH